MEPITLIITIAICTLLILCVLLWQRSRQARQVREMQRKLDQLSAVLDHFSGTLIQSQGENARMEQQQLEGLYRQMSELTQGTALQIAHLQDSNSRQMDALRSSVEQRLSAIMQDNGRQLDNIRQTVDEKLSKTLETRLSESFRLVSERLEQVYKGLGEMQQLAGGVGELKRMLTNVKLRGTWGEIQLGQLLSEVLAHEQYAAQVQLKAGSAERVDFAIRLPGQDEAPVWLPIDAKFPQEDYLRLQQAAEQGDAAQVEAAAAQLEAAIRREAKEISRKYILPPATTDFAVLFLPTEGLYAEAIRRNGLAERLQRECRVVIAGPTTLMALLNSLQMGFRTLAIEKQAAEVWQLLGTVKAEFNKFGLVLDKTQKKLQEAFNTIEDAKVRTRVIERKLKDVETLPEAQQTRLPGGWDETINE